MTPHKHPICNDVLRAPADMPDCIDLHIRREGGCVWSFWQPNPEELAALVMGGSVALAVQGATHPPLSINATTPTDDSPKAITPEESAVLDRAIRKRFEVLLKVTKKALSMLVKAVPPTPERDRIVDRFLEVVVLNQGRGEIVRGLPADPEPTERDIDRYRSDAEEWKAEAERWRKLADDTTTIEQRDAAQEAADQLAATILGEDIDWSDHQSKWIEALDKASDLKAEAERWRALANDRVHPAFLREKIEAQAGKGDRWKDVLDWVLALPELNPPTP